MGFSWKHVANIGLSVLGTIVPGVAAVEQIARGLPTLRGKAKQDAVVELVKAAVTASEQAAGRELLDDPDVEAATRGVVDAVVALNNILAKKAPAPR